MSNDSTSVQAADVAAADPIARPEVPVEEVRPPGGASGGRRRWIAGGAVAVAAVAATAAAVFVLGSRPTPEALRYIPGDSSVVVELRFDVPGDQLQKVGNLLAHFPGFKDQSSLG